MPIYEYLCPGCNVIFQFLVRSASGALPRCPRCGGGGLERVMSTFATSRSQGAGAGAEGGGDIPDLSDLDESDPRSMARAIRHMADEMGEDLGPELSEAISRLEAGEDPEQVERELEEAGLADGDAGGPSRDDGLYEA